MEAVDAIGLATMRFCRHLVGIGRQFSGNWSSARTSATDFISRSAMIEDSGSHFVTGVISVRASAIVVAVSLGFVEASLANPRDPRHRLHRRVALQRPLPVLYGVEPPDALRQIKLPPTDPPSRHRGTLSANAFRDA